jgi:selenocysteine-specific elongation factor
MSSAPRQLVLGTAGHIDHGKTTLVRALSGAGGDRLPEEQRRGITIELGFSSFDLAKDVHVALVDVPGHEALVRTMIAGAGGIDMVLLAISAEDGVMPQTREHLHVCELLGLRHGVVALTKIDRLGDGGGDEELLALAGEDIRAALADTPLADAPIVPVSAVTGQGLDALRNALRSVARRVPERSRRGGAILPIDRVFSLRGQGTVVTGTLIAGTLELGGGDAIDWYGQGDHHREGPHRKLRIRGMHSQGQAIERAHAGMRVALALASVGVDELARGDVLARSSKLVHTSRVLAELRVLAGAERAITRRSAAQVCLGTAHVPARIVPLARLDARGELDSVRELAPGEQGLARLYFETAMPVWFGQRLIVRAFTDKQAQREGLTIGGGVVLDPLPGRGQPARRLALAKSLLAGDPLARVLALIRDAGPGGIDAHALAHRAGVESSAELLAPAPAAAQVLALGHGQYIDAALLEPRLHAALAEVDRFHAAQPILPGMPRATLEQQLGGDALANLAIERALAQGQLRVADRAGSLARPSHAVLDPDDLPAPLPAMLERYASAELEPPSLREVGEALGLDPRKVLEHASLLHRHQLLVRVSDELSYHPRAIERVVAAVRAHLREHGRIDVQALKQGLGLTRKFAVPLLEYLDRAGITRRSGDVRLPGRNA